MVSSPQRYAGLGIMFGMNAKKRVTRATPGARPACRATRGRARAAAGTTPGRERHDNASARTAWEEAIIAMGRR